MVLGAYIVHGTFLLFSIFHLCYKEKVYWTENRRTSIQMRDPKVQTGLANILRGAPGFTTFMQTFWVLDKLHPSLILEELGNKRVTVCYLKRILETGAGIDDKILKQVIKHDPEHREKWGHSNMPRVSRKAKS